MRAIILTAAVVLGCVCAPTVRADTIEITDNYAGGITAIQGSGGTYEALDSSSSYYQADLLGAEDAYEVYGMSVTYGIASNSLEVSVVSSYFDNVGSDGTTLGDLFISTDGWNMGSQSPTYVDDTASTGEDWEYVLAIDNRTGATSGNVTLYKTSDGTINLTGVDEGYVYRANQEATFTAGSNATAYATGTWAITEGTDNHHLLTFTIDMSGTGYDLMSGSPGLGFHWAMTCGNDTIEGLAPVPEPITAVLVGLGFAGYRLISSRRTRAA